MDNYSRASNLVDEYVYTLSNATSISELMAVVKSEIADMNTLKKELISKIAEAETPAELFSATRFLVSSSTAVKNKIDELVNPQNIFNEKKNEELSEAITAAHAEFVKTCFSALHQYHHIYFSMDRKIKAIWPQFRYSTKENAEDKNFNTTEWTNFVDRFAEKFGNWFYEKRLLLDPLADSHCGTITIQEAKTYSNSTWYTGSPWNDWCNLPYGAKLFLLHLTSWDITVTTLLETGIIEKSDIPTIEFINYINKEI